jgi:hypothetical protein
MPRPAPTRAEEKENQGIKKEEGEMEVELDLGAEW